MPDATSDFDIETYYDGQCPLCLREVNMLRRRDRNDRIRFVDIAAGDFDAHEVGIAMETLMARMHGRLPDGTIVEGIEVFRRMYGAVGFGWAVGLSRLPVVSQLLDVAYARFAKHRLRLTGRCEGDVCVREGTPADANQR